MTPDTEAVTRLRESRKALIERFVNRGDASFLQMHAALFDDYFRDSFADSLIGPRMRMEKRPYAFLALGGYGRSEQCVHSDIDVLLLFEKRVPDQAAALVRELLYPLWDMGLDVGHATRSLRQCLELASRDYEVLTSLADARFLCGISPVYTHLMEALRGKVLRRHGEKYLLWLWDKSRQRHERYGDSALLLEPDVKEGLGGLRDYHAMRWMGWARYQITEFRDLERLGCLTQGEFDKLQEALDYIWRARNCVHHLAGRRCDHLYFEYQIQVAESLGFRDRKGHKAVEQFLGRLHGHMDFLKRQHLLLAGKCLAQKTGGWRRKKSRKLLTTGIVLADQTLCFESAEAVLARPHLLTKIFELSAVHGVPLDIEARRLVQELCHLIDGEFLKAPGTLGSLNRILLTPSEGEAVLDEMLNTGVLGALVPEMKGIVHRIQYDEYHIYPVDKHCLYTVRLVKEYGKKSEDAHDALCVQLFSETPSPVLLLWAALLHDIGKGAFEHDHAAGGAYMVRGIMQRMGFSDKEADTAAFLVRQHLLLIETATHRDLNDERVIIQCANVVGDVEHLKMLYLLTVADCRATGPKAWNQWTGTLLRELFFKAHHLLEKGELVTPRAADTMEKKRRKLLEAGSFLPPEELEGVLEQMPPRYVLYTPVKEMLRHIGLWKRLGDETFVLETRKNRAADHRTVTVCARNRPGLFSRISGVLTLNNLDILAAQIHTWRNDVALDIFEVKPPPDDLFEERAWERLRRDLKGALEGTLHLDELLDEKLRRHHTPASRASLKRPDKIVVDNDSSDFFTIVEVYSYDYPGLLYRLTTALFQCGLDIWVAKIATKVDQVVDIFYVRDLEGQKVHDPSKREALREAIRRVLSKWAS